MSERPSRGGPRPYYGHVAGSEDDSNNGNDSIEESEVETQLSISSESSIEYHDEDSDDHEGTGVDDAIELLSPPDENEGEDAIVGEHTRGTGNDDAIELLSPPDENEGEDAIVGEHTRGTGNDDAIELLSPPDENEGEDAIVGEDSKTQGGGGSDVGDDVGDDDVEDNVDENIAFEEYTGKDISTGEVLDQNLPTLGSTSNPLLDPASASHRNATQAVERSNAPTSGFQSAIAVQNQNRDQDVRSARKRSSSGDIDERNQPIIDSDRAVSNVTSEVTSEVEHEGRNHLFGDGDESDPDYNPVDLANLTAEDQQLVQATRKLLSGTWFYLIVGVSAMMELYDLFQKPWTLYHSQEDDMVAEYKNTATPRMRRVAEECHLLLIESTRILGDQFNTIGSHLPCTKEKQYHYNTLRRKPCYYALLPVIVALEWSLVCNKNRSKKVSFRETYKRLFPLFTQNNVCCQHSSTFKDDSGTSSSQERINNLIKDFAQHFLLFQYCQDKNVEPIDVICCLYQMALQHYLVDVEYYRQDIWIRCIEPIHWIFKAENSIVRPIEMLLAMLYNTSSGKIMLELPKGITMKFLKKEAKKGILNHISNMKRNGNFTLSQIGKQIQRGCINLNDWSIEEDPTWWRHDESFVHSLAGRTWHIDHQGWFRHRLDQLIAFKKAFQDEPFKRTSSRTEARSPLEFILAKWIDSERERWQKKRPGYTSAVDWKWSQMIEAKITTALKYRVGALQKTWDEKFTKFFLPILNCYNASNNQKTYFTKQIQTNKKKSNGQWLWTTQFRVDFPSKKFGDWKYVQSKRLRGIFTNKTGEGERHYLSSPPGVRYKQLELLDFLGVPHSQLNP